MVLILIAVVCVVACVYFVRRRYVNISRYVTPEQYITPEQLCKHLQIRFISIANWCHDDVEVIEELKRRCYIDGFPYKFKIGALGFDCEWISQGIRSPVALLQLSTYHGLCVLVQFPFAPNKSIIIPTELKELLEDNTILKLGVGTATDVSHLYRDYNVKTRSFLDLRYLATMCGHKPGGLAMLAERHLNVKLRKDLSIICSNWFNETLTHEQVTYAAADAHVAIKIFHKLFFELDGLEGLIKYYLNKDYTGPSFSKKTDFKMKVQREKIHYSAAVIAKPAYDNCVLEAPDGELLSFIPEKKAKWYLNKNLATKVTDEPLTVRLLFEPTGRTCVDENGESFYKISKENICVVCGSDGDLIRKCVVPKQYKKHFPALLKDCSSHDIVLLCPPCHERSSLSDLTMNRHLETMCEAPLKIERPPKSKVTSYAYTLLNSRGQIPEDRCQYMKSVILENCPQHKELTRDALEEIVNAKQSPKSYAGDDTHSGIVVKYFVENGGIMKLEEMWRKHFLDTMTPSFLSRLWSIRHTEERLLQSYKAGYMKYEDLEAVGIKA